MNFYSMCGEAIRNSLSNMTQSVGRKEKLFDFFFYSAKTFSCTLKIRKKHIFGNNITFFIICLN